MTINKIPTILVVNDDGYRASGFAELIRMVQPFGRLLAIAPHQPQSGKSHSITTEMPLRLFHHVSEPNLDVYSLTGTPVDCVKMAINQLCDGLPDLLVSGINHGSNSSASVVYSGTIAATLEGCLYNIPSIGFSILDYGPNPDFTGVVRLGTTIVEKVLKHGLPNGCCLNVNVPNVPDAQLKGIRVVRQNRGVWREKLEKRVDPHGGEYYWLTGFFENTEPDAVDTDEWALANGFVAVVPTQPDFTHHAMIKPLKTLEI